MFDATQRLTPNATMVVKLLKLRPWFTSAAVPERFPQLGLTASWTPVVFCLEVSSAALAGAKAEMVAMTDAVVAKRNIAG